MDSDENTFLRGLPFLQLWPVEKLVDNPTFCTTKKFSPGTVIVQDSKKTDWIYIVRSGKVTILKKLTAVNETSPEKVPCPRREVYMSFSRRRRRKKMRILPVEWPDEKPLVYKNKADLEIKMERSLPGLHNPTDRLGLIDYDRVENRLRTAYKPHKISHGARLPQITSSAFHNQIKETSVRKSRIKLPEIDANTKGVYLALPGNTRQGNVRSPSPSPFATIDEVDLVASSNTVSSDTLNNSYSSEDTTGRKLNSDSFSNVEETPMFIAVQVLEQGQYFGLSDVVFAEQPSMSLVSNGAECILLSKSYFLQHMTETALRTLRRSEVPYPDEEDLQRKLKEHIDWQAHKRRTYNHVVECKRSREAKKKQFVPQYIGQYNYRTGPI